MPPQTTVRVACRFARGGFAHERKFLIAAPQGGYYTGTAYIGYCFKTDGTPIQLDEPPPGQQIDGLLEARIVGEPGDIVTITVPDGGVCDVAAELIQDGAYVPVEP